MAESRRSRARPVAFRTASGFRSWRAANHRSSGELLVRLFKAHTASKGMTYKDAVDEALCFGWIDGVRRRFDADSFVVRFTARRAKSIWSAVNLKRAGELIEAGRMAEPELAAFQARSLERQGLYSFESKPTEFDAALTRTFRANKRARGLFQERPPGYQRTTRFWVMSAKRPETRLRRLAALIDSLERGVTTPPLTRRHQLAAGEANGRVVLLGGRYSPRIPLKTSLNVPCG